MIKGIFTSLAICSGLFTIAQVHVKDEPHHHNVFENKYVRVLDVHIGPKDTTLYHIHQTPSVFFTLTKTSTTSQLLGRPASRSTVNNPGPPSYDSLGTVRIHRVWNDDTSWFRVMDIELTGGKPQGTPAILQHPLLTLAFSRYLANGYRLQMKTGDRIDLPASSPGYLFVSQGDADIQYESGGSLQQRLMKPGHFIWIESTNTCSLMNSGMPAVFMVLQLK